MLARLVLVCGLLVVANGCVHCGHCKPGIVDCLIGGRCDDCHTGCTSCGPLAKHACAPQFGGETYHNCGCGEYYHGDWKSHPPCADPCDCYGNHTGCPDHCQSCRHLNHGRFCGLKGFVKSIFHGCDHCEDDCTTCDHGHAAKGCTTCGH